MRNLLSALLLCTSLMHALTVQAAAEVADLDPQQRYLAQIRVHTAGEIEALLQRASLLAQQASDYGNFEPIAVVLHGDEAEVFRHGNYQQNQRIIDLAAKLDAFKVIDLRICETWMRLNNVKRSEMPAFVETVPYGPAEERKLKRKGYKYF